MSKNINPCGEDALVYQHLVLLLCSTSFLAKSPKSMGYGGAMANSPLWPTAHHTVVGAIVAGAVPTALHHFFFWVPTANFF